MTTTEKFSWDGEIVILAGFTHTHQNKNDVWYLYENLSEASEQHPARAKDRQYVTRWTSGISAQL